MTDHFDPHQGPWSQPTTTPPRRVTETFGPCWQCQGAKVLRPSWDGSGETCVCPVCGGTGQIVTQRVTEESQ